MNDLILTVLMWAPDASDHSVMVAAQSLATFLSLEDCTRYSDTLNLIMGRHGAPDWFFCTVPGKEA